MDNFIKIKKMITDIVLATRNEGKVREIRDVLRGIKVKLLSIKDFPFLPILKEEGTSFIENALSKARETAKLTGKVALADDSGLEVEALGGAPGIHSAYFAGSERDDEKNNCYLLKMLEDVLLAERKANFKCVAVLVHPDGEAKFVEEKCSGLIASEPKGENGFGYDPLFIVPEYNLTFAELSQEVKNKISHRAKAFRKIRHTIEEWIRE